MSGSWTLTAVGDLMFHGAVGERSRAAADWLWALRPLGEVLLQGDVLFGNFETPITKARRAEPGAPDLYFSPVGTGQALAEYGFDVVNLAHNHIYDFGAEGVEITRAELQAAGLPAIGIGCDADEAATPVVVSSPAGPVAFLGYATAHNAVRSTNRYVACFPAVERVVADVRRIRPEVTAVVVSCHTGAQFNPYPAPETRALARAVLAAGASVFLGHHPHVPQGCERSGTGLAAYSLGDFVAPAPQEMRRRTFFLRVRLAGSEVLAHEAVPCFITEEYRTTLPGEPLRSEIAAHLAALDATLTEGRSDELHFATASQRFASQYLSSWWQELRRGGPRVLWRKLRNLRPYHFQLIRQTLARRLGWSRRH